MGVAVLAQVRSVSVGRSRLRHLAWILVLPDEFGGLVESRIVQAFIVIAVIPTLLPLDGLVFEIHIVHGLTQREGFLLLHPSLATFNVS